MYHTPTPNVADLERELEVVNKLIEKWQQYKRDPYLDELNKHFHHGQVGGSGNPRLLRRLNGRRERNLDKTIDAAKKLVPLYGRQKELMDAIEDIRSGRHQERQVRQETVSRRADEIRILWADHLRSTLRAGWEIQTTLGHWHEIKRVSPKSASWSMTYNAGGSDTTETVRTPYNEIIAIRSPEGNEQTLRAFLKEIRTKEEPCH